MDTLVSMQTFRWVAELGSFVAASKRMNLSAAMTSKHVMSLEERLGVRLLNRTSRKVSLTEAGSAYLVQLVQTLEALEEAELSISQNSASPKGLLRISAPVWVANPIFVAVVADYCHQHPEVRLDMDLSGRLVDVVEEGFDLVLRVSDSPGDHFIARPVASVNFCWVAAPSYLSQFEKITAIDQFRQHDLLWYSGMPDVSKALQHFRSDRSEQLQMKSEPIEPKLTSGNESLLREAALAGIGISVLPEWMIGADLHQGNLVKVVEEDFTAQLRAVYPSRKYLSSKVRTFLDFLVTDQRLDS